MSKLFFRFLLSVSVVFLSSLLYLPAANAGVVLEGAISTGTSYEGRSLLMGELKNTGSGPVSNVKITFSIKDASSGDLLDIVETYVNGHTMKDRYGNIKNSCLLAGEKGSFMTVLDLDSSIPFTYTYQLGWLAEELSEPAGKPVVRGNITAREAGAGTELYGEVENIGSVPVSYINIFFTVRDADGNLVDVSSAYIMGYSLIGIWGSHEALMPGQYAPFIAYLDVLPENMGSYEYKINWAENTEMFKPIADLKIPNNISQVTTPSGNAKFLGEIANMGSVTAKYLSIKFVLKNKDGDVTDVIYGAVYGNPCADDTSLVCLSENQSATFEVNTERKTSQIGEYYYIMNWDEDYSYTDRDSDRDGVRNSVDLCSKTPLGSDVDSEGCPAVFLDADNDGVKDDDDLCPNTPIGATVNLLGCPLDSDNDGVLNGLDRCEGTLDGRKVDTDGCSIYQRDTDNDGLSDYFDRCPNTLPGADIDGEGCDVLGFDVKKVPTLGEWGIFFLCFLMVFSRANSLRMLSPAKLRR